MTETMVISLLGNLTYPSLEADMATAGLNVPAPPASVTFDLARVGFVEPSGVVMLHNLTRYLLSKDVNVYYRNYKIPRRGLEFLDGAGFFEDVLKLKAFPYTAAKGTTLRLREINTIDAHQWITGHFLHWFAACSDRPVPALAQFGVCIGEIFNNIRDHSAYQVGSIFAQWYPNVSMLKLAIGDFGRGIPANVAKVEPNLNGADAIARAFAPRFSTQSTPQNRGAGLDFLRTNVCELMQGQMTVYSGGASIRATKDGQIRHLQHIRGNSGYTGTLFEIILPTSYIDAVAPHEEELIW